MTEAPSDLVDQLRRFIGVESEPFVLDVEQLDVLRFAKAIGEDDALFTNEEEARRRRYGGIIAAPTYVAVMAAVRPPSVDKLLKEIGADVYPRSLQGGNGWTFYEPVRPGDRLTARIKLVDEYERKGSLGTMLFLHFETTVVNQFGELVAVQRDTAIRY